MELQTKGISRGESPTTGLPTVMRGLRSPGKHTNNVALGTEGPMVTAQEQSGQGPVQPPEKKKYNLALPQPTYEALQRGAAERNTTVAHLIRLSVKLGLKLLEAERDSKTALVLRREGHPDTELVFL